MVLICVRFFLLPPFFLPSSSLPKVAFVVNAPWIFTTVWSAVKGILPAATVKKVRIYKKGQNYLDDMQEFVALDQVRVPVGDATERMERKRNISHTPFLCQDTKRISSVPRIEIRVEIRIQLTPLRLT